MEESKVKARSLVHSTLGGGGGVEERAGAPRIGLGKMTSNLFIHMDLHKAKQQVGQCIAGALLVLGQATGKLELTRLTMARTGGKPPPSPLYYTLCLSARPTSKWHFVPRLPNGSPEIANV
jgi:hypothetical protein